MSRARRVAAIGLSTMLLAGVAVTTSAQDDGLVFYVVTHGSSSDPYWVLVNDAAVQAGEDLGVEVNVSFAASDVAAQKDALQRRHRGGRRWDRRLEPRDRRARRGDAGRSCGRHPRGVHGHRRQGQWAPRLCRRRPPRPRDDVGQLPHRERGHRRRRLRLDAGRGPRRRVPGARDRGDRQRLRPVGHPARGLRRRRRSRPGPVQHDRLPDRERR